MHLRYFLAPITIITGILAASNYFWWFTLTTELLAVPSSWQRPLLQFTNISAVILLTLNFAAPFLQLYERMAGKMSKKLEVFHWYAFLSLAVLSNIVVLTAMLQVITNLGAYLKLELVSGIIFATTVFAGTFIMTILGVREAHSPVIEEVTIRSKHLPQAFHGFTLAQVSDLHVSSLLGKKFVAKVTSLVEEIKPHAVVLTGDFVDGKAEHYGFRFERLIQHQAPEGRFFITGNHEYYHHAESWIQFHQNTGTSVLLNSHQLIRRGADQIAIIGLADRSGGHFIPSHKPDLDLATKDIPRDAFKILLAHQPNGFDEASSKGIHLQLSGHTHGGQFFPWTLAVKLVHRYAKGYAQHNGMNLYVHPGTGFWGPPVRLLSRPVVAKIILETTSDEPRV